MMQSRFSDVLRRLVCLPAVALFGAMLGLGSLHGAEPEGALTLKPIDTSRIGSAFPDSSATADLDGDGVAEVFTSMQNSDGHPEVLLYRRTEGGDWDRTTIGVVERHREEIEWIAVGRPFPGNDRICVAASVQHKKDGLVVLRLREPGLDPFDAASWEQGVAKGYAGQGLAFHDVTGDGAEELIYATQAGNELGVLKARPDDDAMRQSGWRDHVIDGGNDRAWWWLDGRFYDLNGNGAETDFFVSSRSYGGSDLGVWQVLQARPGDLSSYRVRRIYEGNALQIDTGYFFSSDRDRRPDVVMVNKPEKQVYLLDGRRGYEVTRVPIDGSCWNVKIIPALRGDDGRDGFVVVAAESPSLFWTFRWRDGAYELRRAMPYPGNYGHPMDGTFTLAELDGEGEPECVVPDSSGSEHAKGLSYLDWDPAATPRDADDPAARVELGER